jgi:hypothetical protein
MVASLPPHRDSDSDRADRVHDHRAAPADSELDPGGMIGQDGTWPRSSFESSAGAELL